MRTGDRLAALLATGALLTVSAAALADEITIDMHAISAKGVGAKIGTVTAYDTANGLVLRAELEELTPGPHGFHVHQNSSCEPAQVDGTMTAGAAAGGHYDPDSTDKHMGPAGTGHRGDLPVIFVEVTEDGAEPFKRVLVAPRLKTDDIKGRALIIHEGGDNYRDEPKALGGGGARVACGVVPK